MIEKVTDLSIKSFKQYTGPAEKFKLKNVIFGYNGRGKSSLAIGLKETYLSGASVSEDKIRFFSKNYVDDNLSLQDPATGLRSKNKIKGVIAHFSANDVKGEEKIKELQKKIVDVKLIRNKIDELTTDVRTAIDTIHDRRRGTAAIQKRNKDLDVGSVLRLYKQDFDEAKKIEADETKLSKIEGDNVIGEKIELIKSVEFHDFTKITDEDIDNAQKIFIKSFGNNSIPSSEIVDWLNKGTELHENGDDCKFCGGELFLHDVVKRVEEYNANEKQQATKTLQNLAIKMAELQNTVKTNLDRQSNAKSSLDPDTKIENSYTHIQEASMGITNARNVILSKVKNIDSRVAFVDFRGDIQKLNDAIKTLRDIRDAQLGKLETQNSNKNELVKGAIGLEILNDGNIKSKLSDIEIKTEELKVATDTNFNINGKIQKLMQAENATSDFADYINDILANLAIHLKLTVSEDGKNYIIQHTQTSINLTILDISEGERNLLALLFFYYELFNDNEQQDFKSDIDLIIVDDPISSMDDINKMYILELMKQILGLSTPQVFIMTHSWDDFTNICYRFDDRNPDTQYSFFEIKKDVAGNSLVAKTKSNIPPYRHNFVEVYEFSQKPDTTNLDDCDIYHIPNIIRQVVEGFLKFKINNPSPTQNNEKQIAKVLFETEWADLREDKKTKLGQLLSVVNVNSHGSSRSPDEILRSAKFLMSRISQVDQQHYDTNKEPVA